MPIVLEAGAETIEWLWRIAGVVIIPMLGWIAITLRDVDQRLGKVEAQMEDVEEDIRDNRSAFKEHLAWSERQLEILRAQRESDLRVQGELRAEIARFREAVTQLTGRIDRATARGGE